MITNHMQLSDAEFEQQFEDASLNPKLFSHEAHLRLAWIHIKKYNVNLACIHIADQIKHFDAVHDKGEKYHETITMAAVKVVHHFMLKSINLTFSEFIQKFPRLSNNFMDLISTHYSMQALRRLESSSTFVEPDLLPFD